jgi:hypothetical protein
MTERIGALLAGLADVDAPPVPEAHPIWRRAGRTRIRRRSALAATAVALGAAALALGTLSSQPIIGPAGPPADDGMGGPEPLPPRLAAPIGQVPTVAQRPTDQVQLLVESNLYERLFFVSKVRRTCIPGRSCDDVPVTLGIGSDHGYRYLVDPRRGSTQFLLAPDGQHAATLEPAGSDAVPRWHLLDLTTGRTLPAVECEGAAGWIRDGGFVCIPQAAPLMLYRIDSRGGVAGVEIDWTGGISNTDAAITPNLLGPNADVLLVRGTRPGTVAVIDRSGRVLRTIPYPDPVPVIPIRWCGPDTVVVSGLDGPPVVIGFDGVVRSSGRVGWSLLGCRPDGSMLFQDQAAFGLWLINPDGIGVGEVRLPRGTGTAGPSSVTGVAIDAFDWRVGGRAAQVLGVRPLEWLDEALLVLGVVGGMGLLIVRRRRKRRMTAATAELA